MNNIIKTTIYVKHIKDYTLMRLTESKYYQEHAPFLLDNPPASTFVHADLLENTEYLVMIEAIGVISREKPGWEVEMIPMYYQGIKQIYSNVVPGGPIFSQAARVGNLIFFLWGQINTKSRDDHLLWSITDFPDSIDRKTRC